MAVVHDMLLFILWGAGSLGIALFGLCVLFVIWCMIDDVVKGVKRHGKKH